MRRRLPAPALVLLLAACANDVRDDTDVAAATRPGVEAPLIGASAGDSADRSCQVVLRDFGRVVTGTGFATKGSRWVFQGRVDVARAAVAEGAAVRLLVGSAGSDEANRPWREVAPMASTAIDDRFDRLLFELDDDALPGVLPGPAAESSLAVIPFLALGSARVFDHNVVVDAAGHYVLDAASGYAVTTPASTCTEAPGATLTFAADWTEAQSGPVLAGRDVVIDYAVERNSPCRQMYNGAPTWSLVVVARFHPMNVVQEALVVDLTGGAPRPLSARLPVPSGATDVELFFRNNDRGGCVAWDSDFGRNYHFPVVTPPPVRGPAWLGNATATISRAASRRCGDAVAFGPELRFGTWARQRAVITDLCFEAWEPGLTDVESPNLWQQLDARVHTRFDPTKPFATEFVALADRVGNNARYAVDLRAFDPFQWGRCADDVPTTRVSEPWADLDVATLELYFTVNGVELRPADGGVFRVVYENYAGSARSGCASP